jgi:hypothetical protein
MNSWQQPNPDFTTGYEEYGIGKFHKIKEKSTYDLSARSELYTSAYTWNLSSVIPVGTRAILIWGLDYGNNTTGYYAYDALIAWDADMSYGTYKPMTVGCFSYVTAKGNSTAAKRQFMGIEHQCRIGASRSLKLGNTTNNFVWYTFLKGYWI